MHYYIAFVLDAPAHNEDEELVMEAGVDLLGGPYDTHAEAVAALPLICRRYRRYAFCAALAMHMSRPVARMEIIFVTPEQVAAYCARHNEDIPYPPPTRGAGWLFPLDPEDRRLLHWYTFAPPPEI